MPVAVVRGSANPGDPTLGAFVLACIVQLMVFSALSVAMTESRNPLDNAGSLLLPLLVSIAAGVGALQFYWVIG